MAYEQIITIGDQDVTMDIIRWVKSHHNVYLNERDIRYQIGQLKKIDKKTEIRYLDDERIRIDRERVLREHMERAEEL